MMPPAPLIPQGPLPGNPAMSPMAGGMSQGGPSMLPSNTPPVMGSGLVDSPPPPGQTNAPNPMLLMALLAHAAQQKKSGKSGSPGAEPAGPKAGPPDALARAMSPSAGGRSYPPPGNPGSQTPMG